jgi:hypothetical protein
MGSSTTSAVRPANRAANAGDLMHDRLAARLGFERALYTFHLAADTPDAGQELSLLPHGMHSAHLG